MLVRIFFLVSFKIKRILSNVTLTYFIDIYQISFILFIENTDTGPISSFNSKEFPRVNLQTIEDALSEMRNSDSVLLIDCRIPNDETKNGQFSGNQRQYKVFLESYPESLEIEGSNLKSGNTN